MIAALTLLLACERPAKLPETAVDTRPPPLGLLVQAGPVRGYLARPGVESPPTPAELRLVDTLDAPTQAAALDRAAAGRIVLAIPRQIDREEARAYLEGMPATGPVTEHCLRAACP